MAPGHRKRPPPQPATPDAPPAADAPQLPASDAAFPRGGAPLRQLGAKRARAAPNAGDGGETLAFAASNKRPPPTFVPALRAADLAPGAKLLGIVTAVTGAKVEVSLGVGLRGAAAGDAAAALPAPRGGSSPALSDIYTVGQYVRCAVDATRDGGRAVALTMAPAAAAAGADESGLAPGTPLTAWVASEEDHGFFMDVGVPGVTAFMAKGDAPSGGLALARGAQVAAVVAAAPSPSGVVALRAAPTTGPGPVAPEPAGGSLAGLAPGTLVNAAVARVDGDGLALSFWSTYTALVDAFSLPPHVGRAGLAAAYAVGARVRARITFVDPAAKAVRATLLPHVLKRAPPPPLPARGALVEAATVARVDEGVGILLDLGPSDAADDDAPHAYGYAHVSNVADGRVAKLGKLFPVGKTVPARVLGARALDGLAALSLRPADVSGGALTALVPGATVSGTVEASDVARGLLVALSPGVVARVPLEHITAGAGAAAVRRHPVGAKASGVVWAVDAASGRATLSLRKGVQRAALPPLVGPAALARGARTHGVVTGRAAGGGVFVSLFGGAVGVVARADAGLAADADAGAELPRGTLVKARVLSADGGRVRLSLTSRDGDGGGAAAAAGPRLAAGAVVAAATIASVAYETVDGDGDGDGPRVASFGVDIAVEGGDALRATLPRPHLADSRAAADALADTLAVGATVGPLLVLDGGGGSRPATVTRKRSLVRAAASLPGGARAPPLAVGAVLPGYVASVTPTAVFVRWIGRATGRAPAAAVAGGVAALAVGDSAAAAVVAVDAATGRATLSLMPAAVGSAAAVAAVGDMFADAADADAARRGVEGGGAAADPSPSSSWPAPGDIVQVTPAEVKDYGLLLDLPSHPDAVALAPAPRHDGGAAAAGAPPASRQLAARVLDVAPIDGVVDVSLRPDLAARGPAPGGAKAWAVGDAATATVELIRATHTVLSLPPRGKRGGRAIAFAPPAPAGALAPGDEVDVTVAARAAADTGGRVLASLPAHLAPGAGDEDGAPPTRDTAARAALRAARAAKAAAARPAVGAAVDATVVAVHPAFADVRLATGGRGTLHATEAEGFEEAAAGTRPLAGLAPGDALRVVILGHGAAPGARAHGVASVSARPATLAAADSAGGVAPPAALARPDTGALKVGDAVRGVVADAAPDGAWVALSATARARLHALDAATDAASLAGFKKAHPVGSVVAATVARVGERHGAATLDLATAASPPGPPAAGDLVLGIVRSVGGAGVRVALGPGRGCARAALTDLADRFLPNALAGIAPGASVRGRVLAPAGGGRDAALSLRPGDGGEVAGAAAARLRTAKAPGAAATVEAAAAATPLPADASVTTLEPGTTVAGYVASVSRAGAFVSLARRLDARVRLSDLAPGFVADPASAFPAGTLVVGTVLPPSGGRAALSLRAAGAPVAAPAPGALITGRVRRAEAFGVFVDIDGAPGARAGLAHVSELADEFVADPPSRFPPGTLVRARVLRVDPDSGRVSLSLRASAVAGAARPAPARRAGAAAAADGAGDGSDIDIDDEAAEADDGASSGSDGGAAGWAAPASDDGVGSHDGWRAGDSGSEDDDDGEASDSSMDVDDVVGGGGDSGDDGAPPSPSPSSADLDDEPPSPRGAASPAPAAGGFGGLATGLAAGWGGEEEEEGGGAAPAPASPPPAARPASSRRASRAAATAAAAATDAAEAALAAGGAPTDERGFERAVAAHPHSSLLWIRYIAHLLSLGEPARARAAADRALEALPLEAAGERFNVWVAKLNLEALHGAPDPAAAAVAAAEAGCRATDGKALALALVSVLEAAGHARAAARAAAALTKKHGHSCKAWLCRHGLALRQGDAAGAVASLKAAAVATPARKHAKLLSRAAVAEFRGGNQEAGRALFERLLAAAPKRLDLWSVYIDQEVKAGDAARVRALLARGAAADLPPKKAKFLFRRALDFEKAVGDEARVEAVRAAARAYVARVGGGGQ